MPELPEVETMRRQCAPRLRGRRLGRVTVAKGSARQLVGGCAKWTSLRGRHLTGLDRHGKWLLLRLRGGTTIAVHPRMSGRLLVCAASELAAASAHPRVVMRLDNERAVVLNDPRRFGRVMQLPPGTPLPPRTGPDALHMTAEALRGALAGTSRPLKVALLDQGLIAGIGNIYADEALWRSRLHPMRRANSLTTAEATALRNAIRHVLLGAIARRGTSFDAGYVGGRNQEHLAVYGRTGLPCRRCGSRLSNLKVAGRTTVICAACQRTPKRSHGH